MSRPKTAPKTSKTAKEPEPANVPRGPVRHLILDKELCQRAMKYWDTIMRIDRYRIARPSHTPSSVVQIVLAEALDKLDGLQQKSSFANDVEADQVLFPSDVDGNEAGSK